MTNKDWEHHERTKAAKEEDIYPQRTQRTQKKSRGGFQTRPYMVHRTPNQLRALRSFVVNEFAANS